MDSESEHTQCGMSLIHADQTPMNTVLTDIAPSDNNPPDIDSPDNDGPETAVPDTHWPDIDVPGPLAQVICTKPGRHGLRDCRSIKPHLSALFVR